MYIRELMVENPLVEAAKKHGGMALKFTSPGRRAVPDRLVLMPGGRVFFVECKAPGQKPTAQQRREHERLRSLGFRVEVIDHRDQIQPLFKFAANDPVYDVSEG